MSDLFAPFTSPAPRPGLRSRVLAAAVSPSAESPSAESPPPPRVFGWLDALASSRSWWLGWSAAMVLLGALSTTSSDDSEGGAFTAETWRRYRASVSAALGVVEVAEREPTGSSPGGAA